MAAVIEVKDLVKDYRLGLELSVIQTLAQHITHILAKRDPLSERVHVGKLGAVLAGIVLGGIVAVSSLPCNPGIFIVIGAAILQGQVV